MNLSPATDTLADFLASHGFDPADLDAPRDHGLTPLMRAALLGRESVVAELLARKVDLRIRNADGNNALWLGCVSANLRVVKRLIGAGIFVDNQNDAGATALMYAASAGRHELVALLLAAGADAYLEDQDGARAVDMAATFPCLALLRHTADGIARPCAP